MITSTPYISGRPRSRSMISGLWEAAVRTPCSPLSKANSPEQGEILEKIGTQVVYPEKDMAVRLAKRLISRRVFNLFELDKNVDISELRLNERLAGKTVLEAQLRNRYGVNIIAISRKDWLTTDITPDYVFNEEDTLVVIGDRDHIKKLGDALGRV